MNNADELTLTERYQQIAQRLWRCTMREAAYMVGREAQRTGVTRMEYTAQLMRSIPVTAALPRDAKHAVAYDDGVRS